MMEHRHFADWASSLQALLTTLSPSDFDYPLGRNELRPKQDCIPGAVTPELRPLYEVCDGLSLPDIHVGYFIEPGARASSAPERGEPVQVSTENGKVFDIAVFGSDGGGGRFAVCLDDKSIVYLPSAGAVRNGLYREDACVKSKTMANSLLDFLWKINADVTAFIAGDEKHFYVVDYR